LRKFRLFFLVIGVAVILSLIGGLFVKGTLKGIGRPKVAIVKVYGVIKSPDRYIRTLDRLEKDRSVKAVVLRVDSPGGVVGACQEIYEKVRELRRRKPVVVSMGSVAASGGLYISVPATKIVANPGTITGSIGVIIQTYNLKGLADRLGVKVITVKSGRFKDLLNPFKEPDPESLKIVQELINDSYLQFVRAVAESRKIPIERVRQFADGRIFTGRKAKELGLVDYLGGLDRAVEVARELSGYPNAVKYEVSQRRGFLERLLSGEERSSLKTILKALGGEVEEVRLMYILN